MVGKTEPLLPIYYQTGNCQNSIVRTFGIKIRSNEENDKYKINKKTMNATVKYANDSLF